MNRTRDHNHFEDDGDGYDAIDEDPSEDDIRRLDHESAFCPDCGAEVWDAVDICPKCFAYLGGNTSHRPRLQNWTNNKSLIVLVILLVLGLLIGSTFWF